MVSEAAGGPGRIGVLGWNGTIRKPPGRWHSPWGESVTSQWTDGVREARRVFFAFDLHL